MRRDLESLHPEVAEKCRSLLSECQRQGLSLMVTSTLRSAGEQAALYAQGRESLAAVNALRAEAGLAPIHSGGNVVVTHASCSTHEFGLAFDVALLKDDLKKIPHWDPGLDLNNSSSSDYLEVGQMGESLGLIWGGRFKGRDLCHFQWTGGLTMEELKASKRPPLPPGIPVAQSRIEEEKMDKVKAGVRSSEFYMALIGAVLPVMNAFLGLAIPVEGVLSIAGVIVSYIISRTVVKKA